MYRTDWAKVSTDSDDSVDLPADATESALHNALTDLHKSGANVPRSSPPDNDESDAETDAIQGTKQSCSLM